MNGVMASWFDRHTLEAPPRLRQRASDVLSSLPLDESGRVARLAAAGQMALDAASAAGSDRGAALDLLAADALITLALLAAAESNATSLGATARGLRLGHVP